MLLRTLSEDTSLAQIIVPIRETVSFKGFVIQMEGTSDTGKTLAIEDVGRIRYEKNGQTIIDADFDYLMHLMDILGGAPLVSCAEAGDTFLQLYITRRFFDDNVETVVPSDNANLTIQFKAQFDTEMASCTTRTAVDVESGTQKYNLKILQHTDTIAGAGNRPKTINADNILMTLISDNTPATLTLTGSNITRIHSVNGPINGGCDLEMALWNTCGQFNLEVDTFAGAAVIYAAAGDITSRLSDSTDLTITTDGAATPEILVLSADFDLPRYNATISAQGKRFDGIKQHKIDTGKGATVGAVQRVQKTVAARA